MGYPVGEEAEEDDPGAGEREDMVMFLKAVIPKSLESGDAECDDNNADVGHVAEDSFGERSLRLLLLFLHL